MNSCQPQWNQSFIYSGIRPPDLRSRLLEVTVWDYDRFGSNEFLGEINLDLGATATGNNDEPIWHVLNMENHGNHGNHGTVRKGYLTFMSWNSLEYSLEENCFFSRLLTGIIG